MWAVFLLVVSQSCDKIIPMKKFNRSVSHFMGSVPPCLLRDIGTENAASASAEFAEFITTVGCNFHDALTAGTPIGDIVPSAPHLFGMPVHLDYVASGSAGTVYKMQIGGHVLALKINRVSTFGEMDAISTQSRARNLVNKIHAGAVFTHGGRRYSVVVSDYIADDNTRGFYDAMMKLYYAYITKGIAISDAHPNNFKGAKLIDQASFTTRTGKLDDIKQLSRPQVDIVKKLVRCIKTNDMSRFTDLVMRAARDNPAIIKYMFFAMKFGRSPILTADKTSEFAKRLHRFESVIDAAYRNIGKHNVTVPINNGVHGR